MIDFLKYRYLCAAFSLVVFVGSIGLYQYKRHTNANGQAFNYSVDFTGGTQILFGFEKPVLSADLKTILETAGWPGVTLREFSDTEYLVRIQEFSNDMEGLAVRIKTSVQNQMPGNAITIRESEAVGPGVGSALRWKSFMALFVSILAMLAYIAWRFWSVAFAGGAVFALLHDAMIMIAAFLLFDREISVSFMAALLMVLGYSINDTIVIFSRIREKLTTMGDASLYDIVNSSLNQTLRRTLLTSISTALVLLSMLLFGGEALSDFAFALLIGVVFGTYSSIYIASPVMMLLYGKK